MFQCEQAVTILVQALSMFNKRTQARLTLCWVNTREKNSSSHDKSIYNKNGSEIVIFPQPLPQLWQGLSVVYGVQFWGMYWLN